MIGIGLLGGCADNQPALPSKISPHATTASPSTRTMIDVITATGKHNDTFSYLDVPIPVKITVTAESTSEVTLYRKPSGTVIERYEIANLPATKAKVTADGKQVYILEWTPPSDDYQDFIWAEANGLHGQDKSYPIRLRYRKK